MTAVNDHYVLAAWSKATGATGHIAFLANGSPNSPKRRGWSSTRPAGGLGVRSKRYSMLVEDGVVKLLDVGGIAGRGQPSGAAHPSRRCEVGDRKRRPPSCPGLAPGIHAVRQRPTLGVFAAAPRADDCFAIAFGMTGTSPVMTAKVIRSGPSSPTGLLAYRPCKSWLSAFASRPAARSREGPSLSSLFQRNSKLFQRFPSFFQGNSKLFKTFLGRNEQNQAVRPQENAPSGFRGGLIRRGRPAPPRLAAASRAAWRSSFPPWC